MTTATENQIQFIKEQKNNLHHIHVKDSYGKEYLHIVNDRNNYMRVFYPRNDPYSIHVPSVLKKIPRDCMMKSALLFAIQEFPQVNCVIIDDNLLISKYNFTIYGKTWYESILHAECYDPDTRKRMDAALQKLQEIIHIDFNVFWKAAFFICRPKWLLSMKSDLEEFYTHSKTQMKTWAQLFYHLCSREADAYIHNKYGSIITCNLYMRMKDWINMKFLQFSDVRMYIDRETIQSYTIV